MINRAFRMLSGLLIVNMPAIAGPAETFDVVVVGATPGGIGAAVSAARLGHSVALVEYRGHAGGMSASGLGKSDITKAGAIGGLWDEFVGRILAHYEATYGADSDQVAKCRRGYFYEPSVAERIFSEMIAEQRGITVLLRHRLEEVVRRGQTITAVRLVSRDDGTRRELRGTVFIDATYEGDLAAYAGAAYRLGRESRDEFDEAHAGVIYMDHRTRALLPGTTGEGDDRLVAYTYRLCLTTDPAKRILPEKPKDYDRTRYLNYLLDLKLGRLDSAVKALSIAEIPNQKYDANMKPWPLGFPFAEENKGYAEASWEERERIEERLRNLTLGLLYFLQNDPDLPENDRELARTYGLAADEFADNGHFPWQLYVREARRIIGEYTLSEKDLTLAPQSGRAPVHADAVCAGEFPIDSFPTRKYEPGHEDALEGYILMLDVYTQPYQIPYRVMVPKDVDGLLVPVACSATHIAFSSVRLEPTWMALGQAAGVAAHLAIAHKLKPREVNVGTLQRLLVEQRQVLTYFADLPKDHPHFRAFQLLGLKGLFQDYQARPDDPLTGRAAADWLARLFPGAPAAPDRSWAFRDAPITAQEWDALLASIPRRPGPSGDAGSFPHRVTPRTPISRGEALTALLKRFEPLLFSAQPPATARQRSWTPPNNTLDGSPRPGRYRRGLTPRDHRNSKPRPRSLVTNGSTSWGNINPTRTSALSAHSVWLGTMRLKPSQPNGKLLLDCLRADDRRACFNKPCHSRTPCEEDGAGSGHRLSVLLDQARSKRSRFITLSHAAAKSRTNFSFASAQA